MSPARHRWSQIAEMGTVGVLRCAESFHRRFGRGPMRVAIAVTCVYFYVCNGTARRASRRYLERLAASPEGRVALGRSPGVRHGVRHFFEFAVNLFDRMIAWGGAYDTMTFEHDGSGHLFELARSGRGALLLGAHLGSFDMLGFVARRYDLVVNVVVFHQNAERINDFLESLGSEKVRLIPLDPNSIGAVFQIRACLARGEFVAILADRVPPGRAGLTAEMNFLGRLARFPLGPFVLAGLLECPVYLALCLRTGTGSYTTLMRPLAPAERVPRIERDKRAREVLARYVSLVESICQRHPYQWCNFYDFWEEDADRGEDLR